MLSNNESKGLALARGFIVLIMPAVHTVLLYSTPSVKTGIIGHILGFLAEQPGAQLFMFQMGLFIAIGKQKPVKFILLRFLVLLVSGYALNFIRLTLPYYWGWLPIEFLESNGISEKENIPMRLFLTGDILQFAAIAYLSCWIIKYNMRTIFGISVLLTSFILVFPFVWGFRPQNPIVEKVFDLFNGSPPAAFFPYFPWMAYPLTGLLVGTIRNRWEKMRIKFGIFISLALIVCGLIFCRLEPEEWNNNFYRLGRGPTIAHIGAAMLWILIFIWIVPRLKSNLFFSFLNWLSKYITPIYLVQWVIIIWMLPLFGFEKLPASKTIMTILITSTISFSLPLILQQTIKYFKKP
jgi:hypothetical protein